MNTFLDWLQRRLKTDVRYLASGSFWLNLNFVITSLFSFLLSIAFAHFVPKDVYGTFHYIISLGGIITALTLSGMNSAVVLAVAQNNEGTFKRSIIAQAKWSVVPFIVALCMSGYYFYNNNTILAISLIIISVLVPISSVANTYSAFLHGKKDFRSSFYYGLIINAIYYGILFITILFTNNVLLISLAFFIATTLGNVVSYILTFIKYKPNNLVDEKSITYGKHMSVMGGFGMIASKIDSVLVFHYTGAVDLAIYTFAKIIPERVTGLFKSVGSVALPKFAQRNEQEIRATVLPKTILFAIFIFVSCLFYILIAPFVFRTFLPNYVDAIVYTQVFSLTILIAAANLPVSALIAHRLQSRLYIFNIINTIVQISVLFVLIVPFGIWGAVYAKIIFSIFYVLFALVLFLIPHKSQDLTLK
ncbi:MAG: oligosaccharide flippase family protein [Patescibacteria group bacterium]